MQVGGLSSLLGSFGLGRIPSISTRQLVGWRQFPSSLLNSPPFKGTLGAELPWLWGPDWESSRVSQRKGHTFLLLNWLLLADMFGSQLKQAIVVPGNGNVPTELEASSKNEVFISPSVSYEVCPVLPVDCLFKFCPLSSGYSAVELVSSLTSH